jgi:hypothetical protein
MVRVIPWLLATSAGCGTVLSPDGNTTWTAPGDGDPYGEDKRDVQLLPPQPRGTQLACSLLGLGATNSTVPFNFPGATQAELDTISNRRSLVSEESLPPGGHADVARVFAADMGWPFEHSDGLVYFTFNDGLFAPDSTISSCPSDAPNCIRTVLNDDFLAFSDPHSWTREAPCIPLSVEHAKDSKAFLPITWNGPVSTGGNATGPDVVPGPGFSSGKFVFLLMPLSGSTCSTDADCAAASGIETDRCLIISEGPLAGDDARYCHFGPCDGDSPCALRLSASSLVVRSDASNFVDPRLNEHVSSSSVASAYRGHFATASFQPVIDPATSSGRVWALGRDSYWGTQGLSMDPYLMFHPVENGVLGEPQYFTGIDEAGGPTFSSDAADAVPLYEESVTLPYHSSLAYSSEFAGGTWLLVYGGHAQPGLRSRVETFVRPASQRLFYDQHAGISLRWAKQPWGPWSAPSNIFNPYTSDAGYCREMFFDDPDNNTGFSCPNELAAHNAHLNRMPGAGMAGEYGAAIVPRSVHIEADGKQASFSWLLSTWNPYRVIQLVTELEVPQY